MPTSSLEINKQPSKPTMYLYEWDQGEVYNQAKLTLDQSGVSIMIWFEKSNSIKKYYILLLTEINTMRAREISKPRK